MTASDAIERRERTVARPAASASTHEHEREPASAQPRRKRYESRWVAVLPPVLVGVLLLGLWDLLVRSGSVEPYLLPAPLDVADRFWGALTEGLLLRYARTTLQESIVGFLLGAAIAVPVGYGIARSRLLARALEPYLAASQAVPAVALAPLLVIWLGYGLTSVVVLCALIVFFPAVVNTALGIRTLDPEVLDAARVDGAGGWPMLLHFELPLALPSILAGLRTSLTLSVTGAVVGEFVLGDQGLGGLLTIARGNFDTPLVFATLVMLMLLAATLYGVARLAERGLLRWLVE